MRNRHDFRNRLRHRHLKTLSTGSMAGFFPVLLMVFVGLWWDTHCTGYFASKEHLESRFIGIAQEASAWVEDYRNQYGCLPDTLEVDCLMFDTLAVKWEGAIYVDTSIWRWVSFYYRHDETSYAFVTRGGYRRFISTPDSSWYIFSYWDIEADSIVSVRLSVDEAVRERLR